MTTIVPLNGDVSLNHIKSAFPGIPNPNSLTSYRGLLPTLPTTSQPISILDFRGKTAPIPVSTFSGSIIDNQNVKLTGSGATLSLEVRIQSGVGNSTLDMKQYIQNLSFQKGVSYTLFGTSSTFTMSTDGVMTIQPGSTNAVSGSSTLSVNVENGYTKTSSFTISVNSVFAEHEIGKFYKYKVQDVVTGKYWSLNDGTDTEIKLDGDNDIEVWVHSDVSDLYDGDHSRVYSVLLVDNDVFKAVKFVPFPRNILTTDKFSHYPYAVDYYWALGDYKDSESGEFIYSDFENSNFPGQSYFMGYDEVNDLVGIYLEGDSKIRRWKFVIVEEVPGALCPGVRAKKAIQNVTTVSCDENMIELFVEGPLYDRGGPSIWTHGNVYYNQAELDIRTVSQKFISKIELIDGNANFVSIVDQHGNTSGGDVTFVNTNSVNSGSWVIKFINIKSDVATAVSTTIRILFNGIVADPGGGEGDVPAPSLQPVTYSGGIQTSYTFFVQNGNPSNVQKFNLGDIGAYFPNATFVESEVISVSRADHPAGAQTRFDTYIVENGTLFSFEFAPKIPLPSLATFGPNGQYPNIQFSIYLTGKNNEYSSPRQTLKISVDVSDLGNYMTFPPPN